MRPIVMLHPSREEHRQICRVLAEDNLHLWLARLDLDDREKEKIWSVLDQTERQRALKFKLAEPRQRFVAGRGLLRLMLGHYLSASPDSIRFTLGEHGKPRLANTVPDQGLVFNVSHSGSLALLGFAQNKKFGVDLEFMRPINNTDGMVRRCFSIKEESAWCAAHPDQQHRLFFSFWTAKEAMIKADGQGMSLGVQRCQLEHHPDFRYTHLPDRCGDPADWALYPVDCGKGFSGALAIKDLACKISYRVLSRKWLFDLYFPAAVG